MLSALLLVACAGASKTENKMDQLGDDPIAMVIDRGYKLGDKVKRVNNYMIDGWQYVSDEAIIIPARPSKHYLVVLKQKCHQLRNTNVIGFTTTASSVLSNFDAVVVYDHPVTYEQKCYIDKMYEIVRDKKQKDEESET